MIYTKKCIVCGWEFFTINEKDEMCKECLEIGQDWVEKSKNELGLSIGWAE